MKRYSFYMLGYGLDNTCFHILPDVAVSKCFFDIYIHLHWMKAWFTFVIRNNRK